MIKYTMYGIIYIISYSATTLNLNINPAYEAHAPLQRNIAYEDTTLDTRELEESQTETIQEAEPTYETIASSQVLPHNWTEKFHNAKMTHF